MRHENYEHKRYKDVDEIGRVTKTLKALNEINVEHLNNLEMLELYDRDIEKMDLDSVCNIKVEFDKISEIAKIVKEVSTKLIDDKPLYFDADKMIDNIDRWEQTINELNPHYYKCN